MNVYFLGGDPIIHHGAEQLRRFVARIADIELNVVAVDEYVPPGETAPDGAPTGGFWLGTRERFGTLFRDPHLSHPMDDGYYIRSVQDGPDSTRLVLAGVNSRSVLFAVYAYLESLGCRWLRPGPDGDVVPRNVELKLDGYDAAEFPDYRYRGVCIEGGVSLEHTFDLVDYMVKQRLNTYFIQFQHAYIFWSRWYDRLGEANTMPLEDAARYTAALAERVKERGLALQMVGHGWTCESLGQPGLGWIQTEMTLPPEMQQRIALVNGQRTWWRGVPIDTELCMSNPDAFQGMVDYIVDYAKNHPEIDHLHVWLSDGWNNRCECEGCRVKRPSDWYVDLLNALDGRLEKEGLATRIVFLAYADLLWAPEKSRLQNQDRFILMFAPLTRTWRTTLLGGDPDVLKGFDEADLPDGAGADGDVASSGADVQGGTADPTRAAGERPTPFRLNKNTFPTSTAVNVHYFRQWKNQFAGDSFAFDYHLLWKHSIVEPTGLQIAQVLHEDIQDLAKLDLDGLVNCQVQRYFFPTGLAMEVTAKTLWDKGLCFDTIKRNYFDAAFGKDGAAIQARLERLSELMDDDLLFTTSPKPDAAYEARLREAEGELAALRIRLDELAAETDAAGDGADGARRDSVRYLQHGLRFMEILLPGFIGIAQGDAQKLAAAYRAAAKYVVEHEPDLHNVLDNRMWQSWLETYASDYEKAEEHAS